MKGVLNVYECDSCGWIYRPEKHDDRELDDQGEEWVCPNCQAGRDHFQLVVPSDSDLTEDEPVDEDEGSGVVVTSMRPVITKSSDPDLMSLNHRMNRRQLITQPSGLTPGNWST
jgi:rubredoxin